MFLAFFSFLFGVVPCQIPVAKLFLSAQLQALWFGGLSACMRKKKLGQLLFGILELATEIWMQQSDFLQPQTLVKSSSNTV